LDASWLAAHPSLKVACVSGLGWAAKTLPPQLRPKRSGATKPVGVVAPQQLPLDHIKAPAPHIGGMLLLHAGADLPSGLPRPLVAASGSISDGYSQPAVIGS
jgi:hypothetical protein